jgi:purine-nucleoside phosphorylase
VKFKFPLMLTSQKSLVAGKVSSYSHDTSHHVNESLNFIRQKIKSFLPQTGIILGTGLGGLVKEVDIKYSLDYNDIPHFPVSTVESHLGRLIFGEISSRRLLIMQGRFHLYEGYSMYRISYPLRIMHRLGVGELLVSNACGAVNPLYKKGDLMIIRDHISLLFDSPLIPSPGFSVLNKRVYDRKLTKLAEQTALENILRVQKGVYCTLRGPNLETRSEYRMIRKLRADVVGMSTVPEALLSGFFNFKVLGFSIVTDVGFPDTLKPIVLAEVLEVAAEAEPKLTLLIKKIIERLS